MSYKNKLTLRTRTHVKRTQPPWMHSVTSMRSRTCRYTPTKQVSIRIETVTFYVSKNSKYGHIRHTKEKRSDKRSGPFSQRASWLARQAVLIGIMSWLTCMDCHPPSRGPIPPHLDERPLAMSSPIEEAPHVAMTLTETENDRHMSGKSTTSLPQQKPQALFAVACIASKNRAESRPI